jgi:23S rRNA (adenine2503-C2)-methyltransferase
MKTDVRKITQPELEEIFKGMGEPKFRAKQVYEWLWKKGAHSFEEMTNLSKNLRAKLEDGFSINAIQEDKVQFSTDGTIKTRYRLYDGHLIESVLIPVPVDKRFTVCVSSQVGCSLTCSFCATGRMKRVRNLDAF